MNGLNSFEWCSQNDLLYKDHLPVNSNLMTYFRNMNRNKSMEKLSTGEHGNLASGNEGGWFERLDVSGKR